MNMFEIYLTLRKHNKIIFFRKFISFPRFDLCTSIDFQKTLFVLLKFNYLDFFLLNILLLISNHKKNTMFQKKMFAK